MKNKDFGFFASDAQPEPKPKPKPESKPKPKAKPEPKPKPKPEPKSKNKGLHGSVVRWQVVRSAILMHCLQGSGEDHTSPKRRTCFTLQIMQNETAR